MNEGRTAGARARAGGMALAAAAALLWAGATPAQNRNLPMGIDGTSGPTPVAEPEWTIQDFEAAGAAIPGAQLGLPAQNSFVLFSQCRAQTGINYAGLAAGESDAVVADTEFAFASPLPGLSSTCFNPQNEQNVVVNPANARHLVTRRTSTATTPIRST
jgi:hypothetical protein